jgi:hypothetical protein
MSSVFDDIRELYFDVYTPREISVGDRIVEQILKSDMMENINNSLPKTLHYRYHITRELMQDLQISDPIKVTVYDYEDKVVYQMYEVPSYTYGTYGVCEVDLYQKYTELMRLEVTGKSGRYDGKEISLYSWERDFYKNTIKRELEGMYGITPSMKVYKYIIDKLKDEIKRIIRHNEMHHRYPRSIRGGDVGIQSHWWVSDIE